VLRPDKLNVMGYFTFTERPHLSPKQAETVHDIVHSGKRHRLVRGRWSNWVARDNGTLKGSPAVICRKRNLIELFGQGADNRTWQNTFVNGKWTGWFRHQDSFTLASTPAVGSMNAGHLLLVACDPRGAVHAKWWRDASGKWTDWEPLGTATLKASPSVICRRPDLVELFGLGLDNRTWQNTFVNGKWTGWFRHEDNFTLASTPNAGSMNPGHLLLVACDPRGAVHAKWWRDTSGKWTDWEPLGSATLRASPSIICRKRELVELFGQGLDNRMWQNSFVEGKWIGWFPHEDKPGIGSTPRAGAMTPDQLQLFATDLKDAVWQKWWFE
jgi:hypothetical protein